MEKEKEPVIRQTENGPMLELRERFPSGWYAAGGFCLLYACLFPLYRLHHFLLLGILAAAVGIIARKLTPERIRLVPYEAPPAVTGDTVVDEILQQGEDALRRLRSANDALPDAGVSAALDRIETACARIFAHIRSNPQQAGQIRKFMNYYLPTLLQLMETLAALETAGAEGKNIAASKQRISAMLLQAADAFDTFYDQLHADQAMNVSAEISVFETMLKQEGLLTDKNAMPIQTRPEFPGLTQQQGG
ncbi:MAG: 5-bromo-4-chloroindolyl phosphate hydrolysis family protein [Oscillospiraceae bacterium]|nr:5-bromo-4-chloroindolyl phosphate hydrolysis family protein [Oscillospiraceae bacterium]